MTTPTTLSELVNRMNVYTPLLNMDEVRKVNALDQAIRMFRQKNQPPWTEKKTTLRIFKDVYFYPVAVDHAQLAILDDQLGKNEDFGQQPRYVYTSLRDFLENPTSRNSIAEIWQSGQVYLGVRNTTSSNLTQVICDQASVVSDWTTSTEMTENFDEYSNGQSINGLNGGSGWESTWVLDSGAFEVTNEQAQSGSLSAFNNADTSGIIEREMTPLKHGNLQIYWYGPASTDAQAIILIEVEAAAQIVEIDINDITGGNFRVQDASGPVSGATGSIIPNNWNKIDVTFDTTALTFTVYLNDVVIIADHPYSIAVGAAARLKLFSTNASGQRSYFDSIDITGSQTNNDAGTPVLDQVLYITGNSSIRVPIYYSTGISVIDDTFPNLIQEANYKSKYFFEWIYLDGIPTSIEMRIRETSSAYLAGIVTTQFAGQPFVVGDWNLIAIDLNTALNVGSVTGNFTSAEYILNGAPTGNYNFDASYLRGWVLQDYWYYSKYNIYNPNGTYDMYFAPDSATYDINAILLGDTAWHDPVMYDACLYLLSDQKEKSIYEDVLARRQETWDMFFAKYPDNTPQTASNMYRFGYDYQAEMSWPDLLLRG